MKVLPLLVRVIAMLAMAGMVASAAEVFSGDDAAALTSSEILERINGADIVLIGEVHTDAAGHFWQQELLRELAVADDNWLLSLEEFGRSQQADLNRFSAGEMTGEQLKAIRNFVGPGVKENWLEWNLPKLQIARDANVPMLASNAPLKYSRMVRNTGCDSIAGLTPDERAMVDCPLAVSDPEYQLRFYRALERVSRSGQAKAMKPLSTEQMAKMFRAHRVWDATMAESLVNARRTSNARIVHIVGSFHSDYNGGLVQEIRARDPDARILVISVRPLRATALPVADQGRADIMVYRGG